jgi:hypothetical protein
MLLMYAAVAVCRHATDVAELLQTVTLWVTHMHAHMISSSAAWCITQNLLLTPAVRYQTVASHEVL